MSFATADLVDDHADVVRSCDVQFRQYGKRLRFHGAIRTIKCANDNPLIKQTLGTPGMEPCWWLTVALRYSPHSWAI